MTRYGLQAVTDNLEGDRRPPELQHLRGEMVAAEVKAHRVELVNNDVEFNATITQWKTTKREPGTSTP